MLFCIAKPSWSGIWNDERDKETLTLPSALGLWFGGFPIEGDDIMLPACSFTLID